MGAQADVLGRAFLPRGFCRKPSHPASALRSVFAFALAVGGIIALAPIWRYSSPARRLVPPGCPAKLLDALAPSAFFGFALQSGFCTGSVIIAATAGSGLMKEMLHLPSADSGSIFCCFCSGFCPAASSSADRQLRRESIAQALRFLLGPDISSQRRRFGFGSPTALQHLGLATARPASIMFLDVAPATEGSS